MLIKEYVASLGENLSLKHCLNSCIFVFLVFDNVWYHVAACQSRLHPMAKSAWASVSLWNFSQSSKFANQMYTLSVQSNVFSFNPEDILKVRWKLCPFSFVVLNEFVVGLICHWLVRLSKYFVISTNQLLLWEFHVQWRKKVICFLL